jgi:hypothetical protein
MPYTSPNVALSLEATRMDDVGYEHHALLLAQS